MTLIVVCVVVQSIALLAFGLLVFTPLGRKLLATRAAASAADVPPLTPKVLAEAQLLPADLEAMALAESEPWARDDVRAALRDRFLERRDWSRVRGDLFTPVGD